MATIFGLSTLSAQLYVRKLSPWIMLHHSDSLMSPRVRREPGAGESGAFVVHCPHYGTCERKRLELGEVCRALLTSLRRNDSSVQSWTRVGISQSLFDRPSNLSTARDEFLLVSCPVMMFGKAHVSIMCKSQTLHSTLEKGHLILQRHQLWTS